MLLMVSHVAHIHQQSKTKESWKKAKTNCTFRDLKGKKTCHELCPWQEQRQTAMKNLDFRFRLKDLYIEVTIHTSEVWLVFGLTLSHAGKSWTTFTCPAWHARCSAVWPAMSVASNSAPAAWTGQQWNMWITDNYFYHLIHLLSKNGLHKSCLEKNISLTGTWMTSCSLSSLAGFERKWGCHTLSTRRTPKSPRAAVTCKAVCPVDGRRACRSALSLSQKLDFLTEFAQAMHPSMSRFLCHTGPY